jgi:hypothetical protein
VIDPPERPSVRIRKARANSRPPRYAATLLALGIIFALAYVFLIHQPPAPPVPSIKYLQGTYVWQTRSTVPGANPAPQTGGYAADASGDAKGESTPSADPTNASPAPASPGDVSAAYSSSRREGSRSVARTTGVSYVRSIGAWPPVWRLSTRSPLDYTGLAADVLAAVQDGDHSIGTKQIKADGRKVWRASLTFGQTEVEVVVDQLTGIVTWCSRLGPGVQDTFTATVDWNAVSPAGQTYSVPVPGGARVAVTRDRTYTYEPSLAAAGAATGFTPLKSTLQPDGFSLRSVATRYRDDLGAAALGDTARAARPARSKARPNEVAQLFTRDLAWFTIAQTRLTGNAALASDIDVLVTQSLPAQLSLQSEILQYGAFTGSRAYTWYSPTGPALFVAGKDFAVSVRGGITRDDLISLAEGLQPLK